MAELETAVPKLLDLAVRGPVVLTRHGAEAFVVLPLDVWRRVWEAAPRPPVVTLRPPKR
jgi:prevent-host-death family protein